MRLEGKEERQEHGSSGSVKDGLSHGRGRGVLGDEFVTTLGTTATLLGTRAGRTGQGSNDTIGRGINFHGSGITITTIKRLLVLGQITQAQAFVELNDLVVHAADKVNDLSGNGDRGRDTIVLDGDEATSTLTSQLEGDLVGLQDAVGVTSVIVGFQVVNGNNGTSSFNSSQSTVVIFLVGQANEDRVVTNELGHDLRLAGNGGLDLIGAHGEQVPGGFSAETNQVTRTRDALDDLLDVGISQVLSGQVEGDLGTLGVQSVQELVGVISWTIIEGEGNNTATLTGVANGSVSKREERNENKSNVDDHLDATEQVCRVGR